MLGYPTAVVDGSKQTLSKALILHPIAAGTFIFHVSQSILD
jgi:hypothetical protein